MGLSVKGVARAGLLAATDLEIASGEAVSLSGPSGAGKTLLLRAIADLDPNDGEVALGGCPRSRLPGPEWRRRVRYVAAEPAWWADHVKDHFHDPATAARAAAALALPADCMSWPVARLSTGEKQRLGLLRAIEDRPCALLLDEPTAALDEASIEAVEVLVRSLLTAGLPILIATHNSRQAERLAARRYRMEGGRLSPERG